MRLKTRLTLAFLLMAWIPLGAAVWVLTERTEDAFRTSWTERREAVEGAVRAQLRRAGREIDGALARMADDPVLEELLLEPLERGRFYGDHERERAIVREAERLITSPAVDTLRLVDRAEGGRVIAMGHRRGVEPADDTAVRMAAEHPGEPFLRHERVENLETGAADRVWTLQLVRPVGERVALVGGRVLDRELLRDLLVGSAGGAAVALEDAEGRRVAATFGEEPPDDGEHDVLVRAIRNPGGEDPVAFLRVYVSRAELERVLARVWGTAGGLAGGSALVALLAGVWISRRISRPLERLSVAASDVAAGDRDRRVDELRGRDEVASLTRAFNRMTEDLADSEQRLRRSERVAAWREIARRIAHEIKNPLFPIQTSIETLQKVWRRKHPDFEEIFDESTGTILEEVGRLKRIVSEFSDFARLPAPSPVPTDLADLARRVTGLHRDVADGVRLEVEAPEVLEIEVDGDQIRQVLTNLVKNALEAHLGDGAAAPGAEVVVRVAPAQGGAVLEVADNGPGLPDAVRDKLFTPYVTTKHEGTGLGLAMVHRIVSEHGGTVRVESDPGRGTRFVAWLPDASAA
ncbi:MAG: sensor histidine kinase [Myxococcota bacterium]